MTTRHNVTFKKDQHELAEILLSIYIAYGTKAMSYATTSVVVVYVYYIVDFFISKLLYSVIKVGFKNV